MRAVPFVFVAFWLGTLFGMSISIATPVEEPDWPPDEPRG